MGVNVAFDLPVYLTKLKEGPQWSLDLMVGSGGGGAELSSLLSIERMHGNGSKLDHGMFRQDIGKHFFTKRVVKHWNRLPRVIDVPSLSGLRDVGTMRLT